MNLLQNIIITIMKEGVSIVSIFGKEQQFVFVRKLSKQITLPSLATITAYHSCFCSSASYVCLLGNSLTVYMF